MSAVLRGILSPSQLAKHYELLQFLASHPNEAFTAESLDSQHLPHGASVVKFPVEWVEFMEAGECGNKNIELTQRQRESGSAADEEDEEDTEIVLMCRRPHITSLHDLASLLDPPSSQPDQYACIGVHTDQILISPELIQAAQDTGLAYYFPDCADPPLRKFPRSGTSGVSKSVGSASMRQEAEEALEDDGAVATADVHSGGIPVLFLPLPSGVVLRSRVYTKRGIVVQDKYSLPVQWSVGERLILTFNNRSLVERAGAETASLTSFSVRFEWGGTAAESLGSGPLSELGPPAIIRQQNTTVPARTGSKQAPVTLVRVDIEPRLAGNFKLLLTVGVPGRSTEQAIDITIRAAECRLPGVLVGREKSPATFDIPPSILFLKENPSKTDGASATSELPTWWNSPSRLVGVSRSKAVYPSTPQEIHHATSLVFSALSLEMATEMRAARRKRELENQREEEEKEEEMLLGKQRRRRRRWFRGGPNAELRNTHLLFYGLDMSLPYFPPPLSS